jgi:hypothetical protein
MTCTRTVVVVILILLVAWVEVVGIGLETRPDPHAATTSLAPVEAGRRVIRTIVGATPAAGVASGSVGAEFRLLPVGSTPPPRGQPDHGGYLTARS